MRRGCHGHRNWLERVQIELAATANQVACDAGQRQRHEGQHDSRRRPAAGTAEYRACFRKLGFSAERVGNGGDGRQRSTAVATVHPLQRFQ